MNFEAIPGFAPKNDNHIRRALGACQCAALRHLYEEPGDRLENGPEWKALQTLKGVGKKPDRVQEIPTEKLRDALDALVPHCQPNFGDWLDAAGLVPSWCKEKDLEFNKETDSFPPCWFSHWADKRESWAGHEYHWWDWFHRQHGGKELPCLADEFEKSEFCFLVFAEEQKAAEEAAERRDRVMGVKQ